MARVDRRGAAGLGGRARGVGLRRVPAAPRAPGRAAPGGRRLLPGGRPSRTTRCSRIASRARRRRPSSRSSPTLRDGPRPADRRDRRASRARRRCPGPSRHAGQRALALDMARAIGYDDEGWRLDDSDAPVLDGRRARRPARHRALGRRRPQRHLRGPARGRARPLRAADRARRCAARRSTPASRYGVHESQSRLWENQVGRSRAFWSHWLPRAQQALPALAGLDLDDFLRRVNVVHPTLIRVEADEATYALHVILRFELELALMEGTLAVADLPAAWNDGMRDLLGHRRPGRRATAACRTSTGRSASSATSRRTRSATS